MLIEIYRMGEMRALTKGMKSLGLGVVVGAVHGVIDGYGDLSQTVPDVVQEAMKYGPAIFAGFYVGAERDGQLTTEVMIRGGLIFAGLTAISTGVGYVAGRIVGGGVDKLNVVVNNFGGF